MVVHQGQTATLSVEFRTALGVAQVIYLTDPTEEGTEAVEGCALTIERGGVEFLQLDLTGSNGSFSTSITFYQAEWTEGSYQVTFSGFLADGTALTRTDTIELLRRFVYAVQDGLYRLADVVPALAKAIGNGPHIVTGEVAYGLTNGVNTLFRVVGSNMVPLSETISIVAPTGVTGLVRGQGYGIDYADSTAYLTTAPTAGTQVLASYQHSTYGSEELLQALCQAASQLADAGLFSYSVEGNPAISVNPNSILDLLMRCARMAILEVQTQRDARTGIMWKDQGMSVDRTKVAANETALLKEFRKDIRTDIAQAKMNGFSQTANTDRARPEPSIVLGFLFEVDV